MPDKASATGSVNLSLSTTATSSGSVAVDMKGTPAPKDQESKAVERAVYGYIQAVRALGRTTVNTVEIAKALSLPTRDVERATTRLSEKGVKPVR